MALPRPYYSSLRNIVSDSHRCFSVNVDSSRALYIADLTATHTHTHTHARTRGVLTLPAASRPSSLILWLLYLAGVHLLTHLACLYLCLPHHSSCHQCWCLYCLWNPTFPGDGFCVPGPLRAWQWPVHHRFSGWGLGNSDMLIPPWILRVTRMSLSFWGNTGSETLGMW